jgi:molybdopterin adenylyltransferase
VAQYNVALVVLSDKAASGVRADQCLPVMRASLPQGCGVSSEHLLADDRAELESLLKDLCDVQGVDGVFTSGGTGLSARDITPQATKAVCDYEVPGIAEVMRMRSATDVPTAVLSRAIAGVRKRTLIINLPGNPKAVRQTLEIVAPIIPHAFGVAV